MKRMNILIPIFLLVIGCTPEVDEEYLTKEQGILQAGYDEGEEVEEPMCISLQEGLKFKEDGIVFVELFDRDFEYRLSEKDSEILFRDTGPDLDPKATPDHGVDYFNYDIKILND